MAVFSDYDQYDGLGLAELVRNHGVDPIDLVEEAIRRIEVLNPQLNAVIHKVYERAHGGNGSTSGRAVQGRSLCPEGSGDL